MNRLGQAMIRYGFPHRALRRPSGGDADPLDRSAALHRRDDGVVPLVLWLLDGKAKRHEIYTNIPKN